MINKLNKILNDEKMSIQLNEILKDYSVGVELIKILNDILKLNKITEVFNNEIVCDDLEGEIWKDIEGYNGKYKISNLGRVKSFVGNKHRILKPHLRKKKLYQHVGLSKNSKIKYFLVHRLVAQAFLKNYSDNLKVNHIDKCGCNNNVNNLKMASNCKKIKDLL